MHSVPRLCLLALLVTIVACGGETRSAAEYETPGELIAAMREAYDGDWYDRLTFVQSTIQYDADGKADTTTWLEAMELPGKLRIDIGDAGSGNTLLFRNDSIYVFTRGVLSDARPTFHPLLLLGFDVYFVEPASVLNKLDSLGFDVSTLSDTTWQDRPTYVVGAERGDSTSQQFWIDKEHLYFVRLLQNVGDGTSRQDVRFNDYRRLGDAWVAPEVEFYIDGRLQLREVYSEVREAERFDPLFFSPTTWRDAEHWHGP